MVPGIRGERIALKIEFMKRLKNKNPTSGEHDLWGIPERLGSVTGKLNYLSCWLFTTANFV